MIKVEGTYIGQSQRSLTYGDRVRVGEHDGTGYVWVHRINGNIRTEVRVPLEHVMSDKERERAEGWHIEERRMPDGSVIYNVQRLLPNGQRIVLGVSSTSGATLLMAVLTHVTVYPTIVQDGPPQ